MTYRVDRSRLGKPVGVSGEHVKLDVEAMEPIRSGVKLIGDEASNSKPLEGTDEFSPKSRAGWNVAAPEG